MRYAAQPRRRLVPVTSSEVTASLATSSRCAGPDDQRALEPWRIDMRDTAAREGYQNAKAPMFDRQGTRDGPTPLLSAHANGSLARDGRGCDRHDAARHGSPGTAPDHYSDRNGDGGTSPTGGCDRRAAPLRFRACRTTRSAYDPAGSLHASTDSTDGSLHQDGIASGSLGNSLACAHPTTPFPTALFWWHDKMAERRGTGGRAGGGFGTGPFFA